MLLSPVLGAVEPVELAEWLLASGLQVRMQLQMHKYIWHPQAAQRVIPLWFRLQMNWRAQTFLSVLNQAQTEMSVQ